jgi:antiviral helicase SKI2
MLNKLPQLKCDICEPDLKEFYEVSSSYQKLTQRLILRASVDPRGSKWFAPGRVVLVRNGVC